MRKLRQLLISVLVAGVIGSLLFVARASAAQCKVTIPSAAGDATTIIPCDAAPGSDGYLGPGIANLVRQAGGDPSGAGCYDLSTLSAVEVPDCAGFAQTNPEPTPEANNQPAPATTDQPTGNDSCGGGDGVSTTINFGCSHTGNPVVDLLFAIVRFLVTGVGVVVIASVIVGGIQYVAAQGEPQKQGAARGRVINALLALLFYLFIFAILQWLVPGGIFV